MTWRNDVYPSLAKLNAGFEQVVEALEALVKACILEVNQIEIDFALFSCYDQRFEIAS